MKTLAELHAETLEQWTLRFHRERGLPEPTPEELAELMRLDEIDFRDGHQ